MSGLFPRFSHNSTLRIPPSALLQVPLLRQRHAERVLEAGILRGVLEPVADERHEAIRRPLVPRRRFEEGR